MKKVVFIFLITFIPKLAIADQHLVIIASLPKCGSFLIRKLMQSLIGNPQFRPPRGGYFHIKPENLNRNQHIFSHAPFREEYTKFLDNGYKAILMIRDPRSQAISFAHFAKRHPSWWPHVSKKSVKEIITTWITDTTILFSHRGVFHYPPLKTFKTIPDLYTEYLGWANHRNTYVAHFEKLVGSKGGGSDEIQREEIKNIAHHFGIKISDERIAQIAKNLFGKSRTFRKGQIDAWKTELTEEQKKLFDESAGELIAYLGHEPTFSHA